MHVSDIVWGLIRKPYRNSIQFVISEAVNQMKVLNLIHGLKQSDAKTQLLTELFCKHHFVVPA
jgi:hypothetical protein